MCSIHTIRYGVDDDSTLRRVIRWNARYERIMSWDHAKAVDEIKIALKYVIWSGCCYGLMTLQKG